MIPIAAWEAPKALFTSVSRYALSGSSVRRQIIFHIIIISCSYLTRDASPSHCFAFGFYHPGGWKCGISAKAICRYVAQFDAAFRMKEGATASRLWILTTELTAAVNTSLIDCGYVTLRSTRYSDMLATPTPSVYKAREMSQILQQPSTYNFKPP